MHHTGWWAGSCQGTCVCSNCPQPACAWRTGEERRNLCFYIFQVVFLYFLSCPLGKIRKIQQMLFVFCICICIWVCSNCPQPACAWRAGEEEYSGNKLGFVFCICISSNTANLCESWRRGIQCLNMCNYVSACQKNVVLSTEVKKKYKFANLGEIR